MPRLKSKVEAKRVAALRISANPDAEQVCFEKILLSDNVRVTEPGFDSRTVRIAIGDQEYFVFAQDLPLAR